MHALVPARAAFCAGALPPPKRRVGSGICYHLPVRAAPRASTHPATQTALRLAVVTAASAAVLAFNALSPANAAISAEQCISGEGPGCDAAAAESPIIRELLEKSRANRAKNDKKLLEEYWARGYGDYFSFGYNKKLVQGEDGKWSLQEPSDLRSQLENRIAEMIRGKKE